MYVHGVHRAMHRQRPSVVAGMTGLRGGISRISSCGVRRGEFHVLVDAAVARQRVAGNLKRLVWTCQSVCMGINEDDRL
jgi:hypothetical protein